MHAIIHIFVPLLVVAATLAGCTGLRLGYQQADIILAWRANSYFDLDRDQRRDFSARLDRLLAWHRTEQLPEYATFLTTAIDKAEHGLKVDDVAWFAEGFRSRYRIVANRGAADAADLLATLRTEQIVSLQKQFVTDNRKFAEEHELDAGIEKQKRARLKRMLKQIDEWAGNLSDHQEKKIAALLAPIPLIEHLRHQDRMRRQREFIELLNTRHAKADFASNVRHFLVEWDAGRSPEYSRVSEQVYHERLAFYVAVDKLLTREQRQHALARLQKYAEDCKALSAQRAAAGDGADVMAAILALFASAEDA
ncbi:MAG: hypothetical protein JWN94_875 [Betaproteobacteria bacterium]|nr:hypothetical protein [Betaproteobacteria bacterium]